MVQCSSLQSRFLCN